MNIGKTCFYFISIIIISILLNVVLDMDLEHNVIFYIFYTLGWIILDNLKES